MKDLILGSSKALVPVAVAGVLFVLSQAGVTDDMSVKEAVTLLITGALVWVTKNKKA